jgi:hypothetical protein
MHPGACKLSRSLSNARKFRLKLLRRIARTAALPPCPQRDALLDRERRRYAMSGGVKAALLRAMKRHKRKNDFTIARMADRFNVLTPRKRPVPWWYKGKDSGGVRRICDPPTKIQLGQLIGKDLIVAQVCPDPCVYGFAGRGIHRYVADIRNALETVGPWAFVTDIRDCYEHVNIDNIYKLDLLPTELIESCIDVRKLSFRRRHHSSRLTDYMVPVQNSTDPRGLMQGGAASAAIVVALLGNVSSSVSQEVWPGGIADDFIVIGADRHVAEEAGGDLTRYIIECPLGPSEFKRSQVFHVGVEFHHVGCLFSKPLGAVATVETCIPADKFEAMIERMSANIENAKDEDRHREIDHFVRKALGPYPWAVAWQRDQVLDEAQAALFRRANKERVGCLHRRTLK